MNVKIEELINQVGTDVSGKWLRIDNAEMLVNLVVKECALIADIAEPYKSTELILKNFGIEK